MLPLRLYTRISIRGLTAAVACIVGVGLAVRCCVAHTGDMPGDGGALPAGAAAEIDSFTAAMQRRDGERKATLPAAASALFAFDPNTADSTTLRRLGLPAWQVGNIMKYRRKGGRWRRADDFRRLYGLSAADFERLRPYIEITPAAGGAAGASSSTPSRSTAPSVPRYARVGKYAPGTVVDLNTTDTASLKRIPGIGSYYARKICDYRAQLGGYVSAAQVREIEGLPEDIGAWVRVDAYPQVRRLDVNKATFRELVRHPYLTYEQVKAVFDYRRKHGPLMRITDLRLLPVFTPADEERLAPYLSF